MRRGWVLSSCGGSGSLSSVASVSQNHPKFIYTAGESVLLLFVPTVVHNDRTVFLPLHTFPIGEPKPVSSYRPWR